LNEGRASRGLATWRGGQDRRILTVRGDYLFALDAKTGKAFPEFGDNGRVDLRQGLNPPMTQFRWAGVPLVVKDVVVIGAPGLDYPTRMEGTPGDVRAYDVRTGTLRWTFHVIPRSGEFGVNTWEDDSWYGITTCRRHLSWQTHPRAVEARNSARTTRRQGPSDGKPTFRRERRAHR